MESQRQIKEKPVLHVEFLLALAKFGRSQTIEPAQPPLAARRSSKDLAIVALYPKSAKHPFMQRLLARNSIKKFIDFA